MSRVRIGVVGIGHLGNYHLQKYAGMPDCRVVGVVDLDGGKAHKAAELYGCKAFADHRDLIGEVDAVSIAVPTFSHYSVARDFLEAGTDVLLEKPIAATLDEADGLIDLAEARGTVFQIGLVERFNPAITALREVMKRPLFIEAHRLHPFFERGTDVDVVLDLMIHDLDIISVFVPSAVTGVDAVGVAVLSNKVDIANARLTFEDGCVANITASRISGKIMQKIRFFGMEGYHAVDYGKRELVSLRRVDGEGGCPQIAENPVEVKQVDPLEMEIRSFIQSVANRTQPAVSGREGRNCLELAVRILEGMTMATGASP
ncbi:MAG: Gfo/Idh/MocA family oxidoreductase [Deltaproteobacteria bacterium]|nr:Gfo/Idh/MocA family oxidoreductase [Deltaproteobacteria bacterium]